jgi:dynein heavy chain 1
MFFPEAFITATRQLTAHVNSWSLEELELFLEIGVSIVERDTDIVLRGLVLENASWVNGSLSLSSDLRQRLSSCRLRWQLRNQVDSSAAIVKVPVYLTESRKSLVVEVRLLLPDLAPPIAALARRGVAIIMR